jgi:hypothetical protein
LHYFKLPVRMTLQDKTEEHTNQLSAVFSFFKFVVSSFVYCWERRSVIVLNKVQSIQIKVFFGRNNNLVWDLFLLIWKWTTTEKWRFCAAWSTTANLRKTRFESKWRKSETEIDCNGLQVINDWLQWTDLLDLKWKQFSHMYLHEPRGEIV